MDNKMIKLRNIFVALVATFAMISNVSAGPVNIGITASMYEVDASGTETDSATVGGAAITDTSVRNKTIKEITPTGSIFVEYVADTSWPMTIGGEYTPGVADISSGLSRTDTETSRTVNAGTAEGNVTNTRKASAEATNFASIYVEAPIWGMLYGRVGVSRMDIHYETSQTVSGGIYNDNIQLTGTNLGLGLKSTTANGTLWKLAYEQTDYDGFTLKSQSNAVTAQNTIKGDADTAAVRFSLAKSF
jgi:hypothetical protein